jgi:hypothetical protein
MWSPLPHSLASATCPCIEPDPSSRCPLHISTMSYQKINASPRPCQMFCNIVIFLLWAPLPSLKLEDRPLSFVRDWLFNIFAPTFHIRRPFLHPQPENAPCCGDKGPLIAASWPWEKQELGSRREEAVSLGPLSASALLDSCYSCCV